ncbi:MAG: dethiobiotin synthase [Candidatus Margulisbacteria bacterium]|nr:dethiobiotin synthase [Candidatus Margulisiibacteriota bacterium]
MTTFFIAGTDTNVGKSLITGLLANYIQQQGHSVTTQKWVQTGATTYEDLLYHDTWFTPPKETYQTRCPYLFPHPASPHLAAKKADIIIKKETLLSPIHTSYDYTLIEGSGGVMVPYSDSLTCIDILQEAQLPVLIISSQKLGTINHTLLTIEALQTRGIPIAGVIFNHTVPSEDPLREKDHVEIIQKITGISVLGTLPYLTDKTDRISIQAAFQPIGKALIKLV